jgi:hypothetical protein
MKLSSVSNLPLLAFLTCLITTFLAAPANANFEEDKKESLEEFRNLRKKGKDHQNLDSTLPTLPPSIKENSTATLSGTADNLNSTKLGNQLADPSSSAIVSAEKFQPAMPDGLISTKAFIGDWQTCTYGKDTCANDWRCCVAPADCWNKKTTCRPYYSCSGCGSIGLDGKGFKTVPDVIKTYFFSPDGTYNKCITPDFTTSPPRLILGLCTSWFQYKIFVVPVSNSYRLQIAGRNLCIASTMQKGATVFLTTCNYDYRYDWQQQWIYSQSGLELRLKSSQNLCLDIPYGNIIDGAVLQLWDYNGSKAQKFY